MTTKLFRLSFVLLGLCATMLLTSCAGFVNKSVRALSKVSTHDNDYGKEVLSSRQVQPFTKIDARSGLDVIGF